MSTDFLVTVHNPERVALWQSLLGTDTVPVRSFVASLGHLAGREPEDVYILDAKALTLEQRHRLVAGLAERFQAEPAEVMATLDTPGIAIPKADCSIMVLNPQRWV